MSERRPGVRRAAAEAFVADDPFVKHGVVARHEIRDWSELLVGGWRGRAAAATGGRSFTARRDA